MDDFRGEGTFWIDGNPDDAVAGTLTFTRREGARLDLIGAFGRHEDPLRRSFGHDTVRILGYAGKKVVTLIDARQIKSQLNMPGGWQESLRPDVVIVGAHLDESTPLRFQSVTARITNLSQWVGRSGISREMTSDGGKVSRMVYEFIPPAVDKAALATGGDLEVGFSWATSGDDLTETNIRQGTVVTVRPSEPMSLREVFQTAGVMRDLLTLAATNACPLEEIVVRHADVREEGPDGARPARLLVLTQLIDSNQEAQKRQQWEMLFNYEQLGGAEGLANWLSLANELQPVMGSLLSVRYMDRLYNENRMQNVSHAAETLHRLRWSNDVLPAEQHAALVQRVLESVVPSDREWLSGRLTYSNEPNLRRRLRELADYAGEPFRLFVGDTKRWVHVVSQARNRLTHFQGSKPRVKGLYYLGESVYVLVVLCLLRLSGASEELLSSVPSNTHIRWLTEHLPATLSQDYG